MITDIKQAIVDKLLEVYPGYKIYDEDIPQGFKTPSFYISLIEQDYSKRINNKYRSRPSFDIAYFSDKGNNEIKNDCYDKQIKLFRAFDLIGTYRVTDKLANVTDNVLHFTFSISYSEIKEETGILIGTKEINTNI